MTIIPVKFRSICHPLSRLGELKLERRCRAPALPDNCREIPARSS